ncbi:ankyrin repeat domain-containing protein 26 [Leptodactylus fuscus]
MKKLFGFGRKKKSGPSSSTSDTGSVLSAGYELKEKDLSKFHRAASSGDVAKIRQLLLKQDINQVDKENRTPLHLACANGHLDVVKLLAENKAKLNVCDNANRSPLMKAIQCQHEPCATTLLEHEADPNVVDVNENAALHLAALIPSMPIAVQLLEHGANINAINKDGCTPLILAVTENHQEMVELLIREGADINSRDSNGRTSLMIAASNGHISLVKYLLQNNADGSIKDLTGWTADDYAINDGHHACSQLIFEYGSKTKQNSSPYGAPSKKKATSMFGSPKNAMDGKFTLGSPAMDKEGKEILRADDLSQAESESSHPSEEADSWPTSDEDDLDFSPKKTTKPSLTQLLHTKKNIIEKGSFTSVQPKGLTLESKSDSEEDSVHDSEDEGADIQPPPKPFPQAYSFPQPVCIKPGSIAKPSQLASASLLGVTKSSGNGKSERKNSNSGGNNDCTRKQIKQMQNGGEECEDEKMQNDDEEGEDDVMQSDDEEGEDEEMQNDNEEGEDEEGEDEEGEDEVVQNDDEECEDDEEDEEESKDCEEGDEDDCKVEEDEEDEEEQLEEHKDGISESHSDSLEKECDKSDVEAGETCLKPEKQNAAVDVPKSNDKEIKTEKQQSLYNSALPSGHQNYVENSVKDSEDAEACPEANEVPVSLILGLLEDDDNENRTSPMESEVAPLKSCFKSNIQTNKQVTFTHTVEECSARNKCDLPCIAIGNLTNCEDIPDQTQSNISQYTSDVIEQLDSTVRVNNTAGVKGRNTSVIRKHDDSFSGDEVDESAKQSDRTETAQPEKVQPSVDGVGRKVALMTELGFEDDDVESPWDSESSESPRKQSVSDVVPPSAQAHMQCISEESNEEMYYCPSFPKQSRSCNIPDEGWHFRQREASDHSTAVKAVDIKKDLFLQTNKSSTSNFFQSTSEKNKPDLMADLGLDDADDIEDASDWDSTSNSFKCTTHTSQNVNSPHHKLHETTSSQKGSDKVTSKENATSHPMFLHSVPEDESEDHLQANQNNSQSILKDMSQQHQNAKTGFSNGNQMTNDVNNTLTEHMVMKLSLRKDGMVNDTNEVISQQQFESRTLAKTLDSQESSSESDDWEEKYEQLWVDSEKKDVKSHFKDITAELKQRFGEMGNKKNNSKTNKSQEWSSSGLDGEGSHFAHQEHASSSEKLPLAAEHENSRVTVTSPLALSEGSKGCGNNYLIQQQTGRDSQEHYTAKNEPFPVVDNNDPSYTFSDSNPSMQKHFVNKVSLSPENVMKNISNPSSETLGDMHVEQKQSFRKHESIRNQSKTDSQHQHNNLEGEDVSKDFVYEDPSKNLDRQLDQEMKRFKNEVGMLQMVFLNLTREREQLQKEVEVCSLQTLSLLLSEQRFHWSLHCKLWVDREKTPNVNQQMQSEKLTDGDKPDRQVEPNIQLKAKSKANFLKGSNEVEKSMYSQTDDKASSNKEKRLANGSTLDVFDDSSLSEISQEGDGRSLGKRTDKQKMSEDVADYSQSSDTATEDSELPTSASMNARLLIKQLNLEGQDSLKCLKIQNIIHEYERLIEKEKGRHALLSREVKKLRRERKEVQQIMEENRELRCLLEHHKVEWESDLNNLRLTLKQEEEKRKSAEMLFDKSKEQLRKKEDQCCKEMEEKQHLELTLRNLELEMRSLKNNMKQVEEERNDAQRLYTQELNARVLNESALNNLKKKNEEEEAKKLKTKHEEQMLNQSSETNEKEKDLAIRNITLQEEAKTLKVEMENMRSHYQEEESRYVDENEMLKEKIEDLRKDLKMNEETLTQTVIQYNGQLNALKTETAMMCSKIEHEKQSKERLETELEAVRSRLNSTIQDLERSQALKTDTERTLQRERDEWLRSKDKLNHELSNLRESHNHLSQQLSRAESKLNGLENELHRTGLSVQDKTLLLDNAQRDLTQAQSKIKDLEQALQVEKDHNNKSSVKQESMQERLAQITSENMQLRQQLEDVQNKGIIKEKAVSDVQDRFTDIFSKLRADTERQVHIVEERNKDLITKSNELREQLYKLETEKVDRESTIRQLQQELADALKKLSMSEASLEVITRYRNDLEEEKQQLQRELEKFRNKLQDLEDQFVQSERCNHQLKNALDDKDREVIAANQKVQEFSTAANGTDKAIKQLEEHVQKLEIENAKIEATAKQQAGQIESLQKELHESVSMRNRLEDMITNLQSTKIGLEEKLNQQVHKQSTLSQNAQDSHNLWEAELKSRSQIGVRLAELEGLSANLSDQIAVEKKKLKKLADQKKSIEERFDQEMKRSNKLQQEVTGLKKLLKTAKKKLKDYEGTEQRSTLREGSRNYETDSEVLKMKEKIEELSSQMEKESHRYMELESINRNMQEEVSTNKKLYKNIERLERGKRQLEDELAELKRLIDSSKMGQNYLDMYKKEVDERGRQELRQQLEEVNLFLQAHAASQDKLEQMRAENDASVRGQMEHRIQDLESELQRLKGAQQENMSDKDSTKQELYRLKELYAEEQKARKSLTSKLERANERLAETNSKLLNERQRNKSLIASTFLNGSMGASPVVDTSHLARLSSSLPFNRSLGLSGGLLNTVGNTLAANQVESYFTKMQQELEKNIAKELDQANAELEAGCTRISPVGSIAGSLRNLNTDQDPVSRATQQYLEVLKKNYMI